MNRSEKMQEITIYDSVTRERSTILFRYLSVYVVALVAFAHVTHRWVNLLFLTTFVLVCVTYIAHVRPGYLKIGSRGKKLDGAALVAVDLLFHWVPWAWVLWRYGKYYRKNAWGLETTVAVLVILFYIMTVDVSATYDVDVREGVLVAALGMAAYGLVIV
jgi:hypothetical protein